VYAVTDKIGAGLIPTGGYNQVSGGESSAGVQMGDWTVQGQRRLMQTQPCRWFPTVSVAVQETLPTGRYDKLGSRVSDGLGAGAYTTNFALYTQTWFWLPNRRIVRMRINVAQALSNSVKVEDASVYGTSNGFKGTAAPGPTFSLDAAWEYSVTRHWVVATDAIYRNSGNTRVSGMEAGGLGQSPSALTLNSGSSWSYGFAPAVEYNFNSRIGVLLGTRIIAGGRNTSETITPAIAINFVH
jgi:hypothetical protein